jgi:hypothetical protein
MMRGVMVVSSKRIESVFSVHDKRAQQGGLSVVLVFSATDMNSDTHTMECIVTTCWANHANSGCGSYNIFQTSSA